MNRSYYRCVLLCAAMFALAGIVFTGTVFAQQAPLPQSAQNVAQPPEWERLTQAQREALMVVVRERWNANPGQRAKMLQHAERWQRMTPEQRQRAQQGQRRWTQMSPEQRKRARAKFEQHGDLPPQQRAALREQLKAMTPEQRREWMRTHRRQQQPKPDR